MIESCIWLLIYMKDRMMITQLQSIFMLVKRLNSKQNPLECS